MSVPDDVVSRATQALDGITPGPWRIDEHCWHAGILRALDGEAQG